MFPGLHLTAVPTRLHMTESGLESTLGSLSWGCQSHVRGLWAHGTVFSPSLRLWIISHWGFRFAREKLKEPKHSFLDTLRIIAINANQYQMIAQLLLNFGKIESFFLRDHNFSKSRGGKKWVLKEQRFAFVFVERRNPLELFWEGWNRLRGCWEGSGTRSWFVPGKKRAWDVAQWERERKLVLGMQNVAEGVSRMYTRDV